MLLETALLSDVIRAVPPRTAWIISNDSSDLIPELLNVEDFNENYWVVSIDDANRDNIVGKIIDYNLSEKIVHMDLVVNGKTLFNSYDRMSMITIDYDFEKENGFIKKHSDLDIYT